jgi:hypothetical protein
MRHAHKEAKIYKILLQKQAHTKLRTFIGKEQLYNKNLSNKKHEKKIRKEEYKLLWSNSD